MHIALLGDSIFDNKVYVQAHEPDVCAQLNAILPKGEKASLLAVDGGTTHNLPEQVRRVKADMSHVIVSIGGNNALGHLSLFQKSAHTVAEALLLMSDVKQKFEQDYRSAMGHVARLERPTAICTIYNPRYMEMLQQTLATTALSIFNDVIIHVASEYKWPVLDLRLICTSDADYANPIEPSAIGGEKIAKGIARLFHEHDYSKPKTVIWG
jgi:hypothetical protein